MSVEPTWEKGRAVLYAGDCVEVMQAMEAASVDCVVCDPPYGLEFMGKQWDAFKAKDRDTGAKNPGQTRTWCDKESSGIGVGGPRFSTQTARDMRAFQEWSQEWCREAYRVLKPGGHLLAFGGTRTYHRLACAVEDAGFEVRDCLSWLYGSGFPKSLDVSKAIDKKRDDRDEVLEVTAWIREARDAAGISNKDIDDAFGFAGMAGHWTSAKSQPAVPTLDQVEPLLSVLGVAPEDVPPRIAHLLWELNGSKGQPGEAWFERPKIDQARPGMAESWTDGKGWNGKVARGGSGITDAAREWEGWGTALKPAWEPVVVARKPLIGTVADNVQTHGTGALNIDGCRIGSEERTNNPTGNRDPSAPTTGVSGGGKKGGFRMAPGIGGGQVQGRWPANVTLDETAAEMLDAQAGDRVGGTWNRTDGARVFNNDGADTGYATTSRDTTAGGPSRFFYVAKASRSERNAGCGELEEKQQDTGRKAGKPGGDNPRNRGVHARKNHHPTVKPVALMRWLVRLVCPPGGTVLDPFAGSGTTGVAAVCEKAPGRVLMIEREADYVEIVKARVSYAVEQVEAGADPFPITKKPNGNRRKK